MKSIAVAAVAASAVSAHVLPREAYEKLFFEWLQTHKMEFKSGKEFVERLEIFASNHDLIEAHNAKNLPYQLGHNAYSHMTQEEFQDYFHLGGTRPGNLRRTNPDGLVHEAPADMSTVATSVDWTTVTGVVTPVKNQGNCGSCWSFSATGGLEGIYGQKYPQSSSWTGFSEQELVSCDNVDSGCNGGWMDDAFAWIKKNQGICSESGYPYTSGTTGASGTCKGTTSCTNVANSAVTSWTDVTVGSVSALESAVAKQPVSIAIQANQPAFRFYKSGVITDNCGQRLDHGVLNVGYGVYTDGTPYWKVKNSWGTDWGQAGYVLIERSDADVCGVLDAPSYPSIN